MKLTLCSLLLILSQSVHAMDFPGLSRRDAYCMNVASIYVYAAQYRDVGGTPQQAYKSMRPVFVDQVADTEIKRAINQVFFDWRFTYAKGEALLNQVFNICTGKDKLKPLK